MSWLTSYQVFKTVTELNEAIRLHEEAQFKSLHATVRTIFTLITRHAVKVPEAAHLKAATLADLTGCSEKTVRRALLALESRGMIRKVPTMREVSGGKGANILLILPFGETAFTCASCDQSQMTTREKPENPRQQKDEHAILKEEALLSFKPEKNKSTFQETRVASDVLKHSIPTELFTAFTKYFKDDAETVYRMYGILLRAKAAVSTEMRVEDEPAVFVEAWHQCMFKAKQGKIRCLDSYVYRAFHHAALIHVRRKTKRQTSLFDWLEKK